MKKLLALFLALLLTVSVVACGDPSTTMPDTPAEEAPQAAQDQPQEDPEPYTPKDPIVYTGTGDDVIELDDLDYFYCFKISGNANSRHFAVKTYDSAGEYSELLVNTTEPYDGLTYDPSYDVSMIEVTASGEWTIEVLDLITVDQVSAGDAYSGNGDSLFFIPDHGKTATISGNSGAHHFAVKSFDNYGNYNDLLVNTTEPYDGKVMLGSDAILIQVAAQGDWTFTPN